MRSSPTSSTRSRCRTLSPRPAGAPEADAVAGERHVRDRPAIIRRSIPDRHLGIAMLRPTVRGVVVLALAVAIGLAEVFTARPGLLPFVVLVGLPLVAAPILVLARGRRAVAVDVRTMVVPPLVRDGRPLRVAHPPRQRGREGFTTPRISSARLTARGRRTVWPPNRHVSAGFSRLPRHDSYDGRRSGEGRVDRPCASCPRDNGASSPSDHWLYGCTIRSVSAGVASRSRPG